MKTLKLEGIGSLVQFSGCHSNRICEMCSGNVRVPGSDPVSLLWLVLGACLLCKATALSFDAI